MNVRPFPFDERTAVQAVAAVIDVSGRPFRSPGHADFASVLSVLYMAERFSYAETGMPLFASRVVVGDGGPLLADVAALRDKDDGLAAVHLGFRGGRVFIREHPGRGALSPYAFDMLGELAECYDEARYSGLAPFKFEASAKGFGEWRATGDRPKGAEITVAEILAGLEMADEAEEIEREMEARRTVRDALCETTA